MLKAPLVVAFVAVMALVPAYGETADELKVAQGWCTEAKLKQLDENLADITDAEKKKSVMMALEASKAELKKDNIGGCAKHVDEAIDRGHCRNNSPIYPPCRLH